MKVTVAEAKPNIKAKAINPIIAVSIMVFFCIVFFSKKPNIITFSFLLNIFVFIYLFPLLILALATTKATHANPATTKAAFIQKETASKDTDL